MAGDEAACGGGVVSTVHFLQLACEAPECVHRFPEHPVHAISKGGVRGYANEVASVAELRADAASKGWETKRHTQGRDLCPPCRVAEIQRLYGWAFEDGAVSA